MGIRVQRPEAAEGDFRELNAREANDRIAEKAERLRFVSRVPMLCECSVSGCRKLLMISLDEYRQIRDDPDNFLTAHGHYLAGAELDETKDDYAVQRVRRRREGNGDSA
jgi:hypothetical protein